jgi:DNA-binding NtrC family response regulator
MQSRQRFREDLYYRLNTLTIAVPPIREPREEIPLLMKQMFYRGALEFGKAFIFSDRIIEAAQEYHWPGNLRELRNFVTRTLIMQDEECAYSDLRARTRTNITASTEATHVELALNRSSAAVGMKGAVNEIKNETEIRMLQDAPVGFRLESEKGWC